MTEISQKRLEEISKLLDSKLTALEGQPMKAIYEAIAEDESLSVLEKVLAGAQVVFMTKLVL